MSLARFVVKFLREPSWIPLVILAAGSYLTFQLQANERAAESRVLRQRFDFQASQIVEDLQNRLNLDEQMLQGVGSLFSLSSHVDRRNFSEYVHHLQLPRRFPGVVAVGFSPFIPAAELTRHIAAVQAEGFPQYTVWPGGHRTAYAPRTYLEPFTEKNKRAFGFDALSDPVRRAAMEKAIDADLPALSGNIRLVQDESPEPQPSAILFLPIYRSGSLLDTPSQRHAALIGWVDAAFQINGIVRSVLGAHAHDVGSLFGLDIFDSEGTDPAKLSFDSNIGTDTSGAIFHVEHRLDAFGRTWTVSVRSLPAFELQARQGPANLITAIGMLATLLLSFVVWMLLRNHKRVVGEASNMGVVLRESQARQQKLNRALHLLSECNIAMVRAKQEHVLLNDICQICVEKGGYLMAWVGWAEHDEGRTVRPVAQSGFENGYLDGIHITWGDDERGSGPTGLAIRTGKTQINQNAQTNRNFALWREAAIKRGFHSSIALPLLVDTQVLGCLTMYAREADGFDEDEVRMLEELASDLSFGMQMLRTRAAHSEAEEQAAYLRQFDKLTGLPNRFLLRDRFELAVSGSAKAGNTVGLLFLNIDRFQDVNASLGHVAGDALLCAVAQRISARLPSGSIVSRHGADEFVILVTHQGVGAEIGLLADLMCHTVDQPFQIENNVICVTASIGISLYPSDGKDFDEMFKAANTAMHRAKEAGRNTSRFYTRAMNLDAIEQLRLTGRFLEAIKNNEFCLYYQPQVDLQSGKVVGAEALIRWQHPVEGMISPARFIPIAERSGHIVRIGEWVLRQAVRQARAWMNEAGVPLVVAVNVSSLQFCQPNLVDMVISALRDAGLPPYLLELELTESVLLQERSMEVIAELKRLGVKLSIDDFGTGYSSLSYLKQMTADKLKIDQSFVRDMLISEESGLIVDAIIQLGHGLRMTVIAEGVETREQRDHLTRIGCDELQGYVFSKPVTADEFAQMFLPQVMAVGLDPRSKSVSV